MNMVNIKRILISVMVLVCYSCAVFAQSNFSRQSRAIEAALTTVDAYSVWATIADDEAYYDFLELFKTKESPVYNDLLGISSSETLTAENYARILRNGLQNKKVFIKNIKNEGINVEGDLIRVRMSADKAISYIDSCGAYFSSSEFYNKDHHLVFSLVYDNQNRSCKIESITGSIESPQKLQYPFFVFQSEEKQDSFLLYQGKTISFNSYHQALFNGNPDLKRFKFIDPNVYIKPYMDECNHVSVRYREYRFRLKAHYDLGLGNAYKLEGTDNSLTTDKNSVSNIGLDFGYVFPSKGIMKAGVFLGVGFAQSRIDFGYTNADYYFSTSADVDGDSYIRHYQNLNIKQGIKLTDLTIPLYADISFHFSSVVNLFVDLGVKFHFNMNHKMNTAEGSAYTYGIYPQYNNLRMDEHWGYNGFGNTAFSATNLDNTVLLDVSSLTIDALGSIGLRFNIPETPLALDLGVSYQMGLSNVIKANNTAVSLADVSDPSHALVYNTLTGQTSTEHLRNLTESLTGVKRQVLMFNIGLAYKF